MKAVVWTAYGPPEVLRYKDVEKPLPATDQILVRIRAASVSAGDCEARRLDFPFGLSLPMRLYVGMVKPKRIKVLGQEFSGVIEQVGNNVSEYNVGEKIFGTTGFRFGAYAEYICLPAHPGDADGAFIKMSEQLTFEEAAGLPVGGMEALHFMKEAHAKPGESILVNGAGGSIGTIAIQLAKRAGLEVTAVDSVEKFGMLQEIGADHVVDYKTSDFTRLGKMYDIILDVVGEAHFSRSLSCLNANGRFLIANPNFRKMIRGAWVTRTSDKRVFMNSADHKVKALRELLEMCEQGIIKPVVGQILPLEQAAHAHRIVEDGKKQGSLILTVK